MNEPSSENSARTIWLSSAFWALALLAIGIVSWKFFGADEQPMETKILWVFSTFAVCAVLFRLIRNKSTDERLDRWTFEAIEWSDTGISAILLAFFIMAFVIQAFKIPSGSMIPTLRIGDHLFVNKFVYGTQMPFTMKRLWTLKKVQSYDVVVFLCPPSALSEEERRAGVQKDFIKRAVGLPGETIEIRDKVLYVNGEKASDPLGAHSQAEVYPRFKLAATQGEYQKAWERGEFTSLPLQAIRDNFGPVKVPAGSYFVMGDNRDASFDSRFWGPLDEKYVKGRAWFLYWPFSRMKNIR